MQIKIVKSARQYDNRTRKELIQLLLERSCPPSMQSFVDRLRAEFPNRSITIELGEVGVEAWDVIGEVETCSDYEYTCFSPSINCDCKTLDEAIQEMKGKIDATKNS